MAGPGVARVELLRGGGGLGPVEGEGFEGDLELVCGGFELGGEVGGVFAVGVEGVFGAVEGVNEAAGGVVALEGGEVVAGRGIRRR